MLVLVFAVFNGSILASPVLLHVDEKIETPIVEDYPCADCYEDDLT